MNRCSWYFHGKWGKQRANLEHLDLLIYSIFHVVVVVVVWGVVGVDMPAIYVMDRPFCASPSVCLLATLEK